MLLPLLILASLGYVVFAIFVIRKERRGDDVREIDAIHPGVKLAVAGCVPLVVAGTMTYLFWVLGS